MCPAGSGQIHTSCQAGGIARVLMRAISAGSLIGRPAQSRKLHPRPRRRRVKPGSAGSTRTSPSGTSLTVVLRHDGRVRVLPAGAHLRACLEPVVVDLTVAHDAPPVRALVQPLDRVQDAPTLL